MKKKLNIVNVGKIVLEDRLMGSEDEDHSNIYILSDGMEMFKMRLSMAGLKALRIELDIHIKEMERLRPQ